MGRKGVDYRLVVVSDGNRAGSKKFLTAIPTFSTKVCGIASVPSGKSIVNAFYKCFNKSV